MVSNDALPSDEGIEDLNPYLRPWERELPTPSSEEIRNAFRRQEGKLRRQIDDDFPDQSSGV